MENNKSDERLAVFMIERAMYREKGARSLAKEGMYSRNDPVSYFGTLVLCV
jgi:hypothetical protein